MGGILYSTMTGRKDYWRYKKLMPCLKGYGRYTVFSIFTIIIEAVFEMLIPLIMKVLIDTGIEEAKAGNYAPFSNMAEL